MIFNTISVIGLGYIGLPTAAMIASKNRKVIGVDVNEKVVNTINAGNIHIIEPGLKEIVKEAVNGQFLKSTTSIEPSDAFIIAVPTPFLSDKEDDSTPEPDLSFIKAATESIAKVLKKGNLVILESTSPVGTTEKISEWLSEARPDLTFPHLEGANSDIRISYCPERVLPGKVISELVENDRIIGGITESCSNAAIELYEIFVSGKCITTNSRTAEMAKLTENSYRDVNIAFANELSIICDKLNIDVWELIGLANRHPRVDILQPGPGVGGHCIAVDPWFIVHKTRNESKLIATARQVNDYKPEWVIEKVKIAVAEFLSINKNKSISDITISCFGLAFKPDIDDLRESPALNITKELTLLNFRKVLAVEPNISMLPKSISSNIDFVTISNGLKQSDICLLLVDHSEFKSISKSKLENKIIIDTKGIWG